MLVILSVYAGLPIHHVLRVPLDAKKQNRCPRAVEVVEQLAYLRGTSTSRDGGAARRLQRCGRLLPPRPDEGSWRMDGTAALPAPVESCTCGCDGHGPKASASSQSRIRSRVARDQSDWLSARGCAGKPGRLEGPARLVHSEERAPSRGASPRSTPSAPGSSCGHRRRPAISGAWPSMSRRPLGRSWRCNSPREVLPDTTF